MKGWQWMPSVVLVWALVQGIAADPVMAQGVEQGYTMPSEASRATFGVALPGGTWEVWPGDGCERMVPGEFQVAQNVEVTEDAAGAPVAIVAADSALGGTDTCQVEQSVLRGRTACVVNPWTKVCDITWDASGLG